MFLFLFLLVINSFMIQITICKSEDVCYGENNICSPKESRYLFYDVNPPEGFNLRRDVYMRMAVLAHKLSKSKRSNLNKFKLVLPPWSHLVHWDYSYVPEHIPWSYYFDVDSMKLFAPVIDMYEFFDSVTNKYTNINIDEVYILQHFEDMFETGNFEDRMKIEECTKEHYPSFYYYDNVTSNNIQCLSYHGSATKLTELLEQSSGSSILIDHAEVALHDMFGNKMYWQARRSMKFNRELKSIANKFRSEFLNSFDDEDNTILPEDWRNEKPKRNAIGGPYLAVHMRRKDFVRSRPKETPSLENVSLQIIKLLETLGLDTVFIATDAPAKEYNQLVYLIKSKYKIFKYKPSSYVLEKFKDGGVAIIDQIICSHARYFVGSQESTFSFRIQEEREILGFNVNTTFNALCNNSNICPKPSKWKIVY